MATEPIIYEQPLNEQMRLCLRIEYLLQQIEYHIEKESPWDARAVISAIFDILNVIDRPDLKNKLGQILNQYLSALTQLEQAPNINRQKLRRMLEQLRKAIDTLHAMQGKVGQELRGNEFLLAIQQRLTVAAGGCSFNTPAYHLWLQQTPKTRLKNLLHWCESFEPIQKIIALLLQLTRDSTEFRPRSAKSGFYQANLDPNIPYQMIRLQIGANKHNFYPEISVGRHRLTVHFFELNVAGKATQTKRDVEFGFACCKLYTKEEQNNTNTPVPHTQQIPITPENVIKSPIILIDDDCL